VHLGQIKRPVVPVPLIEIFRVEVGTAYFS